MNTAKFAVALLVAGLTLSPLARAAEAPDVAPAAKAEVKAEPKADLPALVKQLGDDNPKARDEASQKLRKVGKDALPALAEAQKSDDPEVATRAQAITRLIDEDLHPKPKPAVNQGGNVIRLNGQLGGGGFVVGGRRDLQIRIQTSTVVNGNGKSVSITKNNGVTVKETTVNEEGKTVKIREDGEGIAVTTTEKKDGKDVSETVKAKDKDALKKDNPKAFELFDKHTKGNDVQINGGAGGVNVGEFKIEAVGGDVQGGPVQGGGAGNPEVQKLLREAQVRVEAAQKEAEEARKQAEVEAKRAQEQAAEAIKKANEQAK